MATTRKTLFAIIENLAADEAAHERRVPSTRNVSQRVAENGGKVARGGVPARSGDALTVRTLRKR